MGSKWPFGNLGIGISASASALQKFFFGLTKCFMKNTPKYFFLHLVMWRQYRSATITHFVRVSYHISTEIPSKTSMVGSFLKILAGLPGSLSYVDLPFCREQVSTCFCRKDSTGDIISGVLKTCTAEGCSLQGCIVTY